MKSMHIRDFLRGGYKDITEPTLITKHDRPIATWRPWQWTQLSKEEAEIVGDHDDYDWKHPIKRKIPSR